MTDAELCRQIADELEEAVYIINQILNQSEQNLRELDYLNPVIRERAKYYWLGTVRNAVNAINSGSSVSMLDTIRDLREEADYQEN